MRKYLLLILLAMVFGSCKKKVSLSFTTLPLQAAHELNDIAIWNRDTMAVCGGLRYDVGDIYMSYDGGKTWVAHEAVIDKALYSICFADARHIYATGYDGKLMISQDYGQTWNYRQLNYTPSRDIAVLPGNKLIVCGGDGIRHGIMYNVSMQGDVLSADTAFNEMRSLFFKDSLHGFACGYGEIMKTTDGGITWANTGAKGDFFKSISVANGTVYSLGTTGTFIYSDDDGKSWNNEMNGSSLFGAHTVFNAMLAQPGFSVICGNNGKIMVKTNSEWQKIKNAPETDFTSVMPMDDTALMTTSDGKVYVMEMP